MPVDPQTSIEKTAFWAICFAYSYHEKTGTLVGADFGQCLVISSEWMQQRVSGYHPQEFMRQHMGAVIGSARTQAQEASMIDTRVPGPLFGWLRSRGPSLTLDPTSFAHIAAQVEPPNRRLNREVARAEKWRVKRIIETDMRHRQVAEELELRTSHFPRWRFW